MRARLMKRLRMPSPGLLVALLALLVALGGTAYAATATVVNIADPSKPANKAAVNAAGQLETTGTAVVNGTVASTIPRSPFFGSQTLPKDEDVTLIAANKATVALTRLDFENPTFNTEPAEIDIAEIGGNATTCDESAGGQAIGEYSVQPGATFSDAIGSPIVLQPLAAGDVWCLEVEASFETEPNSYLFPAVAFSGYVSSGALPAGAVATNASATPGARPHGDRAH